MRIGAWTALACGLLGTPALAHERPGREVFAAARAEVFAQADADGNGLLAPGEFATFGQLVRERMRQRRFEAMDADRDGGVSLAELEAFRPRGRRGCGGPKAR